MDSRSAVTNDVRALSSEALITVAGIVTSVLTVAINTWISHATDFNFLSVSHWFVIPTGAAIGGMAAASGYYFAAVKTHTMPSRKFAFEAAAIGASTWFLGLYIEYSTLTFEDGTRASSYIGFFDYFKFQAENTSLRIGQGNDTATGPLGSWGYAREAAQLLGFMFGGFVVATYLSDREACNGCRKYAKVKKLLIAASAEKIDDVLERAGVALPGVGNDAQEAIGAKKLVGFDLMLMQCPKCQRQWVRPLVVVEAGNSQDRRKLSIYSVNEAQAVSLSSAASTSIL